MNMMPSMPATKRSQLVPDWSRPDVPLNYDYTFIAILDRELPKTTAALGELSHTWVRFPRTSRHAVQFPILTMALPGSFGELIGQTTRENWDLVGLLLTPMWMFTSKLAVLGKQRRNVYLCGMSCVLCRVVVVPICTNVLLLKRVSSFMTCIEIDVVA